MTNQVVSADGTTLFVDNVVVGGIEDYTLFDGVTPDVPHRPISGPLTFLPGLPDYGQVRIRLYRNPKDPGQVRMDECRAQSRVITCKLILIDGTIREFPGYVKQLPLMGGNINGTGLVTAVIKVAGPPQ